MSFSKSRRRQQRLDEANRQRWRRPGWAVNGEHIARSRLRVDTRKWLLSKCLPMFGDRITASTLARMLCQAQLINSSMTAKEAAAAYEEAIKGISCQQTLR